MSVEVMISAPSTKERLFVLIATAFSHRSAASSSQGRIYSDFGSTESELLLHACEVTMIAVVCCAFHIYG